MERPSVFGIGLNKTGTTSIGAACEMLGYHALHHQTKRLSDHEISHAVGAALAAGAHPFAQLPELKRYNAFFDVRAVEQHYAAFDRHYPGAKFILHRRDVDAWLTSREKHVQRNLERGVTTWTVVDRDGWRREYEEHYAAARAYFRDRPADLLEIDVTVDPSWEPICEFLGLPVPHRDFPFQNAANRSQLDGYRERLMRRIQRLRNRTAR